MASFQIHRDNSEKENPSMLNIKEKSALHVVGPGAGLGVKQPLAVIGGKEKAMLAPRANLGVLNTNKNHGNVPRTIPIQSGKLVRGLHIKFHHNFVVVCCSHSNAAAAASLPRFWW